MGIEVIYMNIKDAKKEIKNTIRAYLMKDETGAYRIPAEKQRPLFLLGVPGVGKTAIMEQIAEELGVNLVSYTITHHTRQSAIGLPFISKREYGGKEYSVTEYTMSEIIASIYESIERSGIPEGILFLDEINCVSETLAPTMLQFLQYKTFGMHSIPEGFIIVTAGNPPEYNRSVREFDIATLDRLRVLKIEEDLKAWRDYAYSAEIHGSILAYLEIRKDHFFRIQQELEGKSFVTARGWEDLSRMLKAYEDMKLAVNEELVMEYLSDKEIARDFTLYYELYRKYWNKYRIPEILEGHFPEDTTSILNSPFDEKLSLLSLIIDGLNQEFIGYANDSAVNSIVFSVLKELRDGITESKTDTAELLGKSIAEKNAAINQAKRARTISRSAERQERLALIMLEELERELRQSDSRDFALLKQEFTSREEMRQERIITAGKHLSNAFEFIRRTFGEGQELVIFLSELSSSYYSLKFVSEVGNDAYYRYNEYLLLQDRKSELRREVEQLLL